jgi:uncharacterized lipoprotein YajG
MKKLFLIPAFLLLAACQSTGTQVITTQKFTVVEPPASMYNCPVMASYPKVETLTDVEVARIIVTLQRNNRTCRVSIESIKTYIDSAKKTVNQ